MISRIINQAKRRNCSVRYLSAVSSSSKLPPNVPSSAAVRLPRSLIAVSGLDSAKFLNGLLTIRPPEITGLERNASGVGAYAALLNAKGRIMTDVFVYPAHDHELVQSLTKNPGDPCYVLEIDSDIAETILNTLDFHILTLKIELTVLNDSLAAFSIWNDDSELDMARLKNNLWTTDTRASGMGIRALLPPNMVLPELQRASIDEYRLRRYLFGIPEGSQELLPTRALPLDSCMDYMGGIDFHKGCYLGQELTIRTHHHGNVRKRIMPVVFMENKDEVLPEELYKPVVTNIETGTPVLDLSPVPNPEGVAPIFAQPPFETTKSRSLGAKRPSGKIVATLGNVGLAKMRIDTLGHEFRVNNWIVKPMVPFWWPQN